MRYTVIIPTDIAERYGQRSFQIIQADFQKIGVQLTQKTLDDSAAYNAILANHYGTSSSRCGTGARCPTRTSCCPC